MNDIDIELTERYKDEIWNLELNKQELLQKIYDLSQSLTRSTTEQNRLAREKVELCQEIEHFKTIQHTCESNLALSKEQHEQEAIGLKKLLHTMRIEKDQISKQLQDVLAIQQEMVQQQNALRHVDSTASNDVNAYPGFSTATATAETNSPYNINVLNSTSLVARHEGEIKALSASLDQAHEIIQSMHLKIDVERNERIEVDKLLREAQETIEQFNQHHSPATLPQQPQQSYSPTTNSLLSPNSPASISNRQRRTISRSTRRSSQNRKRLAVLSLSLYPRGKSLCDELSQAGSIGNFMSSSPISNSNRRTNDESIATAEENQLQSKSLSSFKSHHIVKEKDIALSCVELPSISNHDLFSSFKSPSTTSKSSTNDDQTQLRKIVSNQDDYGSLIKEPESYFYKSKRVEKTINKQKQKSPSLKLNFANSDFNMDADFSKQDGEDNDSESSSATSMTRTMIGDWMWKYTRKVIGSGISENRHRRFFWIHPYAQTLYWSTREPGNCGSECSTKSGNFEKKNNC